jgi:orotate phosphoribosyltransferase
VPPEQAPDPHQEFLAQRKALRDLINDYGLIRAPNGSRELLGFDGKGYYAWQFQMRAPLLRPQSLTFVARCFWGLYLNRYKERPFQIAGADAGSLPIMSAILMCAPSIPLNAFSIRKQRKTYGICNMIEGRPTSQPVVIVDDLTSPIHETMWHTLNNVMQLGLPLYGGVFVVVWKGRREQMAPIPTSQGNLRIESIYTAEDFDLTIEGYLEAKKGQPA